MKKILSLLLISVFAFSVGWAEEVVVEKTLAEIATANNWTVSAGQNVTCYTSFALDENITISTTGEANCGSFWGSDWRLYQNKGGNVIVTAANSCTLKAVTFTFTVSNTGALLILRLRQLKSPALRLSLPWEILALPLMARCASPRLL